MHINNRRTCHVYSQIPLLQIKLPVLKKEVFLNVRTKDVKFVNYTYNHVPRLLQLP